MKSFFTTFFSDLGITIESLDVIEEWDDLSVTLRTPDSPLLIGMHGKNIEAFQHILGRIVEKKLGKFVHLHLEVNDYMKSKEERLYRFLDTKIAFVCSTGKATQIPNLSSYERKKAHGYIAEKKIEGLITKSEWEGTARALNLSYTGVLTPREVIPHIVKNEQTPRKEFTVDLSEDGVGI